MTELRTILTVPDVIEMNDALDAWHEAEEELQKSR
jgi:hypothetical protein